MKVFQNILVFTNATVTAKQKFRVVHAKRL